MDHHGRFVKLRDGLAQEVLERIRTDAAGVPWPLKGLLLELAKDLFNPQLHIGQVWQRLRQKDHSLSSRFACRLGPTPKDYLEERRMEVAARLLALPDCKASVEVVGQLVGYSSVRWFQRVFLRRFGVTAGEYRRHGGMPPAKPETDLSMLSTDEIKKRLSAEVAKINPDLARASWVEVLHGGFPFSTPLLFEQLLELSRELGRRDRQIGIKLAENAVASLEQLRGKLPEAEIAALEARGWAWVGNARRFASDFWAAEEAFVKAKALLSQASSIDVEAEVTYLEVGMQIAQRRLNEALENNERLLMLHRRNGTAKQVAEALLDRAEILRLRGEAAMAILHLEEASPLIDACREPLLALSILYTLARSQTQVGAPEKACQALPTIRALTQSVDNPNVAVQVEWLEGLIYTDLGEVDQAVGALQRVRHELRIKGDVINEAVLTLDLAKVKLAGGQGSAAAALAAEALLALEQLDVPHGAAGALVLLRQALETESVTASTLSDVRNRLETWLE